MDESDTTALFASPSSRGDRGKEAEKPESAERPETPANQNARFDAEEARETALRRELEGVRNINQVIEGVIATLDKAKGNMNVGLAAGASLNRISDPSRGALHH